MVKLMLLQQYEHFDTFLIFDDEDKFNEAVKLLKEGLAEWTNRKEGVKYTGVDIYKIYDRVTNELACKKLYGGISDVGDKFDYVCPEGAKYDMWGMMKR